MTKFKISWINFQEFDTIYSVNLDLSNQATVEDCIIQTIKNLNDQFKTKNSSFSLNENPKLYNIYYAKKNGFPKDDYPCNIK